MRYPFVLAVSGAVLGGCFALLSLGFARVPGWRALRWFALIAASAGGVSMCNAIASGSGDDAVAVLFDRLSLTLAAINGFAWLRYSAAPPRRDFERLLEALVLAVALLGFVPGALVGSTVLRRDDAPAHANYVVAPLTPLGIVACLVLLAVVVVPLGRYLTRWRKGEVGAGALALALAGLLCAGALDALNGVWIHGMPFLMPIGVIWTVFVVGCTLANRLVDSACELDALSTRLDATVEERTRELARSKENLNQMEKLAVLGRLSAAVAHEINNPAAAIAANLGYMRDALKFQGNVADDAVEVISDTLESIDRITRIVQQLGGAGEQAIRGGPITAVSLVETVRQAVADARGELREGVVVSSEIPEDIYVQSLEGSLRQVITGLIATAAQAMRASKVPGCIRLQAVRDADRVYLRVVDPNPARDEALQARRFDLFLSARPTHVARGVGISVSVALLRVFGGSMTLETRADGCAIRIELQAGEAPVRSSEGPISSRVPRARLLLIDDDVLIRIGLRRLLGREYVLDEAETTAEALAFVAAHGDDLDAIVCDLVMPDGGAGRVLEELERIAPRLAEATVLMTGGAVDEETQALLDAHADRVLRKPVDVASLRALIERVRRHRSQPRALATAGK